jgi:hypothetical protein
MTENRDKKVIQIFASAESALTDEHFRARVMLQVSRKEESGRYCVTDPGRWFSYVAYS